ISVLPISSAPALRLSERSTAVSGGKSSDNFFSNATSNSFASSALSLFLAARAPCAQFVALSCECRSPIWPSSRSRRAADSSEERTGALAAVAAARVLQFPSLRGGNLCQSSPRSPAVRRKDRGHQDRPRRQCPRG